MRGKGTGGVVSGFWVKELRPLSIHPALPPPSSFLSPPPHLPVAPKPFAPDRSPANYFLSLASSSWLSSHSIPFIFFFCCLPCPQFLNFVLPLNLWCCLYPRLNKEWPHNDTTACIYYMVLPPSSLKLQLYLMSHTQFPPHPVLLFSCSASSQIAM